MESLDILASGSAAFASQAGIKKDQQALNVLVMSLPGVIQNEPERAIHPALNRLKALLQDGVTGHLDQVLKCCRDLPLPAFKMSAATARFIESLKDVAGSLKAQLDFSALSADGITRSSVRFMAPEVFKQLRQAKGYHPTKCDLLVIGGGPAGAATAYYAGDLKLDCVLLEANYLGSSMSDARAIGVKFMRTGSEGSSLAHPDLVSERQQSAIGMPAVMEQLGLRQIAVSAREFVSRTQAVTFPRWLPGREASITSVDPVARAESFAYFVEVAERAAAQPGVFISERTKVTQIEPRDAEGRFRVRSSIGHEFQPRYIVFAGGAVGDQAQHARRLPVLDSLVTSNPNLYQLAYSAAEIHRVALEDSHTRQLIVNDALLGESKYLQQTIRDLSPGTKVALIGSGESMAKSAVYLASLNPGIQVCVFAKTRLEPALGQNPSFGGAADANFQSIQDKDYAATTLRIVRDYFGTPVTPESMQDILDHVQAGRIKVFEMGMHFNEESVRLKAETRSGKTVTQINLGESRELVKESLAKQTAEWGTAGLLPSKGSLFEDATRQLLAEINGPIIVAAGYDREKMRKSDPLFQQMEKLGMVQLRDDSRLHTSEVQLDSKTGLFSEHEPNLAFVGASNINGPGDGVFSGGGLRALLVAQSIAAKLGKRIPADEKIKFAYSPSGRQLRAADKVEVPNDKLVPSARFPGSRHLAAIARKAQHSELSPAEKLVLKRGDELQTRMRGVLAGNQLLAI